MIKLVCDEDFDNRILHGIMRRYPDLNAVRIQDVGLSGTSDPVILEWAYQENRVLLTHDRKTMPKHVAERVRAGKFVAGVIVIPQSMPIGQAIEDVLIVIACALPEELCEQQVLYFPL